jgi:fatty-acyl-CoA synthase
MIEWWGPIIQEYYSSTEAAGYTRITSEEWLERPGSVGRSVGKPFHICDEDGIPLAPGQRGLIYAEMVEGTQVSYHKAPGKTASAFHPVHSHWLSVGDMGYLDEDGYLYLTDRKSFMIISGGVNIYPQQIEDALALHDQVADVAVIGVPHEDLGEQVLAVIQLAEGVVPDAMLIEELKAFLLEKLGVQLVPRLFEFVEDLPRMPTGKLNKQMLRDSYAHAAGPFSATKFASSAAADE